MDEEDFPPLGSSRKTEKESTLARRARREYHRDMKKRSTGVLLSTPHSPGQKSLASSTVGSVAGSISMDIRGRQFDDFLLDGLVAAADTKQCVPPIRVQTRDSALAHKVPVSCSSPTVELNVILSAPCATPALLGAGVTAPLSTHTASENLSVVIDSREAFDHGVSVGRGVDAWASTAVAVAAAVNEAAQDTPVATVGDMFTSETVDLDDKLGANVNRVSEVESRAQDDSATSIASPSLENEAVSSEPTLFANGPGDFFAATTTTNLESYCSNTYFCELFYPAASFMEAYTSGVLHAPFSPSLSDFTLLPNLKPRAVSNFFCVSEQVALSTCSSAVCGSMINVPNPDILAYAEYVEALRSPALPRRIHDEISSFSINTTQLHAAPAERENDLAVIANYFSVETSVSFPPRGCPESPTAMTNTGHYSTGTTTIEPVHIAYSSAEEAAASITRDSDSEICGLLPASVHVIPHQAAVTYSSSPITANARLASSDILVSNGLDFLPSKVSESKDDHGNFTGDIVGRLLVPCTGNDSAENVRSVEFSSSSRVSTCAGISQCNTAELSSDNSAVEEESNSHFWWYAGFVASGMAMGAVALVLLSGRRRHWF